MAFTRSLYDQCSGPYQTAQNASIYQFQMDPSKYYGCSQARVPLGLFGGNQVSVTKSNMVDQESMLRGQDVRLGKCPSTQRQANCFGCDQPDSGMPCDSSCPVDSKTHLNEVSFFKLPQRPTSNGISVNYPTCPASNGMTSRPPINATYNIQGSSFNPVHWK